MEQAALNYKSVKAAAKEWRITTRMVRYYAEQERIPGAVLDSNFQGTAWLIPKGATKPGRK